MRKSTYETTASPCAGTPRLSLCPSTGADAQSKPTTCPAFFDWETSRTFNVRKWSDGVLVSSVQVTFTYPVGTFHGDFWGTSGQYTFANLFTSGNAYELENPWINTHCSQYVTSVSGTDTVWQAVLPPPVDDNGGDVVAVYNSEDDSYGAGGEDPYGDSYGDGGAGYCEYDISSDGEGDVYLTLDYCEEYET